MAKNALLIAALLVLVLVLLREAGIVEWKLVQSELHTSQNAGWAHPGDDFRFERPVKLDLVPVDPTGGESSPPFGAVRFTDDQVEVEVAITRFDVTGSLSRPFYKRARVEAQALLGHVTLKTLEDGSESQSLTIRDESLPLGGVWTYSGKAVYRGSISGRQVRDELRASFREAVIEDLTLRIAELAPAVSSAGE